MKGLLARGAVAFVGLALSLDVARAVAGQGRPAEWWLGFRGTPWTAALWTVAAASLLIALAARPQMAPWRQRATLAVLGIGAVVATLDSVSFYRVLARGKVHAASPWPLSLFVALGFVALLRHVARGKTWGRLTTAADLRVFAVGVAGAATALALGQMLCFGTTDYRRPADAVVVFGARVYADGTPSLALEDRVRTASRLVLEGRAPILIVSGGPGDGDVHETDAMRALAVRLGVPAQAVIVDRGGVSTDRTAADTANILRTRALARRPRVLAVSHGYHLPRVKLALEAEGLTAYTVPARETRTLVRLPYYMAREAIAFWAYSARSALPHG